MPQISYFTVEGRPVPAARMTYRQVHANKLTPQAKRYLDYKTAIGWAAKKERIKPLTGNVKMTIELHIHGNKDGDIDNYAKAILDGLNGIAYKDDKQVTELRLKKIKVESKDNQRAVIVIERAV